MKRSAEKTIAVGMGYVNLVVHNLVSFVLTPLMIGIWGDGAYGLYKIILSLMTYFMLIDAGIKNSVIRFVSEYRSNNDRESARKYVSCLFAFYTIASIILLIVVTAFSHYVPRIYAKSLTLDEIGILIKGIPWVLVYTIGTLFFNCFTALVRGYNKQITVQSFNIARSVLRFVTILIMLKSHCSVVMVIAADAIISVMFSVIVIAEVFIGLKLPPKAFGISREFVMGIFSYSSIMLVYTIAHSLFWSVDNFVVGVMTSSVTAAVYTTSVTLTNMFQSLSSAVSQVLVPDIMLKGFQKTSTDELNSLMIKIGKIKAYVMYLIILGFGIFGKEFVDLWVGPKYYDTYVLALIVMIPLFLGLIQDVPNNIMLARNQHKLMAIITAIAAIINVVASVALIKTIGIYGVAIGTIVAYAAVYVFFTYWYFTNKLDFNMKSLYVEVVWKNLPLILVMVIIGYLLLKIQVYGWIGLVIKAFVFVVVYSAALCLISADRGQFIRAIKKARMK